MIHARPRRSRPMAIGVAISGSLANRVNSRSGRRTAGGATFGEVSPGSAANEAPARIAAAASDENSKRPRGIMDSTLRAAGGPLLRLLVGRERPAVFLDGFRWQEILRAFQLPRHPALQERGLFAPRPERLPLDFQEDRRGVSEAHPAAGGLLEGAGGDPGGTGQRQVRLEAAFARALGVQRAPGRR